MNNYTKLNQKMLRQHFRISMILAVSINGVIGNRGKIPWGLIDVDIRRFKQLTTGNVVLMGRKTWESLPDQYRPLPNRTNLVLTTHLQMFVGAHCVTSTNDICRFGDVDRRPDLFVIGGAHLYNELGSAADQVFLTMVDKEVEGDAIIEQKVLCDWQNRSVTKFRRHFPPAGSRHFAVDFADLIL